MSTPLVVEGLRVADHAGRVIVEDVSFSIAAGQSVGIVGESGSGKTTMALALLGWARNGVRLVAGSVQVSGVELVGRPEEAVRKARGRLVSYVPQAPAAALNPSMRVGRQVAETVVGLSPDERAERVRQTFELVELPSDAEFQRRYPHELSGGQQQRVGLAMALVNRPRVLVLDEPTTGLDVITQEAVLAEVDRLRAELAIAVVSISHDLALVAKHTERVIVMHNGRMVEQGDSHTVLANPEHPYTRSLVAAVVDHRAAAESRVADGTRPESGTAARERPPLLSVRDLHAGHGTRRGRVVAAEGITFELRAGECLAVVGQSGSGKTTIARSVVGLHQPDRGSILLDGAPLASRADRRSRDQLRRVQYVFQDPFASLNPRRTVLDSVVRPLGVFKGVRGAEAEDQARRLLDRVRLRPELADAFPGELSGGECQRVAIARALAAAPDLLVCDEITSALDVSVQSSVLDLVNELRRDLGLALLFISHDLGVVSTVAEHVLVLERGQCREFGPVHDVLGTPGHEYTRRLVAAAPSLSAALVRAVPAAPGPGAADITEVLQ
ncbi:ABC transporter ATP-binding protein [Dactylosporangium sp. NPDC000555]|uniref:ABC transporter ATP-binding protein n=1 Tax=Dactylosporangium sp. NPDC000555 TaxID=3154260 RepID=UPI00332B1CB3